MKYRCPVCFFAALPWPPEDHNICICCGTEFDLDDFDFTHDELRAKWVESGQWFSEDLPPPPGWNAVDQLRQSGYLPKITAPNVSTVKSGLVRLDGLSTRVTATTTA